MCCATRDTIAPAPSTHPPAPPQDEEDAKRGLYNWFAKVQQLFTPARLAASTVLCVAAAVALSDACTACLALALCSAIAVGAASYADSMIGGIVGDFLGATVAVTEVALYLLLRLDLCGDGMVRCCVLCMLLSAQTLVHAVHALVRAACALHAGVEMIDAAQFVPCCVLWCEAHACAV